MPGFDPFPALRYHLAQVSLEQVMAPPYDVIDAVQRPAAGIDDVVVHAAERQSGQQIDQFTWVRYPYAGIEDDQLAAHEVKTLIAWRPQRFVDFIEALLDHLEHFLAQRFGVHEVRRIDDRQAFRERQIVQGMTDPGREIVVEFRIVEARPQQAAPEMVIDAVRRDCEQSFV